MRMSPFAATVRANAPGMYAPNVPMLSPSPAERSRVLLRHYALRRGLAAGHARRALELQTLSGRGHAIVARRDVDDAAVRVRAIQCRALRPTNDLEPLDRRGIELPDEQRVRDL